MPGIGQDNTVSRSLSDTPNDASGRTARALPNSPLGSAQGTASLPNIVTFTHADSFGSRTSQRALGPESPRTADGGRRSLSYALRPEANVYYDSRAATRDEWKRRDRTLQDYYGNNPQLLPQLPFTWHHGWKRWRLFIFAILVFIDGSLVPIVLYYALRYAGHVQGWIIFAVVTSIWGGPTYVEFGIRTWRLMKKERFFRPLGTNSRWCFDTLNWASVLTITAVTALFIVGSAPHIVWLRVLCMPAPAILYCLGGVLGLITLFNYMNWRAPFRLSSTGKGEKVLPGVYYFIEDVVAVNAGAGRPYREAFAARYNASPRFRQMLFKQSVFWSVPALLLAGALTVIAVVHEVPATVAYGVCWAVPFIWCAVWGWITVIWCKRDMVRERVEWEQKYPTEKHETATNNIPLAAV
ncbi:hypothetical protein TGAM01_v210720 [Trichoderma gamsii]|uniref:Uncharacterized protein n=1 Tax=Trichoderma gamsii TaxID=398673 RepID=A0A0W7VJD0_9HYPO|nr:hypothetical protein TGAM01_v210720 [Trichoderma gamsii]PNP37310.1 hypothetical protein TGAMA5MH_10792 [Trichoderma gamsii]PON20418.1 hypothetical protein TGAM01_v210720 [Trichoderma gamsii]